jgi:hypothetical protein
MRKRTLLLAVFCLPVSAWADWSFNQLAQDWVDGVAEDYRAIEKDELPSRNYLLQRVEVRNTTRDPRVVLESTRTLQTLGDPSRRDEQSETRVVSGSLNRMYLRSQIGMDLFTAVSSGQRGFRVSTQSFSCDFRTRSIETIFYDDGGSRGADFTQHVWNATPSYGRRTGGAVYSHRPRNRYAAEVHAAMLLKRSDENRLAIQYRILSNQGWVYLVTAYYVSPRENFTRDVERLLESDVSGVAELVEEMEDDEYRLLPDDQLEVRLVSLELSRTLDDGLFGGNPDIQFRVWDDGGNALYERVSDRTAPGSRMTVPWSYRVTSDSTPYRVQALELNAASATTTLLNERLDFSAQLKRWAGVRSLLAAVRVAGRTVTRAISVWPNERRPLGHAFATWMDHHVHPILERQLDVRGRQSMLSVFYDCETCTPSELADRYVDRWNVPNSRRKTVRSSETTLHLRYTLVPAGR